MARAARALAASTASPTPASSAKRAGKDRVDGLRGVHELHAPGLLARDGAVTCRHALLIGKALGLDTVGRDSE